MANPNELSAKLQAAGSAMVPSAFEQNVKQFYAANKKRLLALVGGEEKRVALYVASAFAEVNRTPQLLQCKPETFFHCLIYSMGTGLLPGPMQQCHYIPYKDEAVFVPGYQGLCTLCYNSGFVTKISGHVVWEKDEFDYDPVKEDIHHRLCMLPVSERGQRVGAYATIKNIYGETLPQWYSAEEIASVRARSRASKSKYSPWNSEYSTDVDQMWIKTPFRRLAKWVSKSPTPQNIRLARALELDNVADTGKDVPELLAEEVNLIEQRVLELPESKGEKVSAD